MRGFSIVLIIALLIAGFYSKSANAAATPNEKAIGTSCSNGGAAADFDAIAQCSATSGNGTMKKAPIFVGAVTAPPYSGTTCDANKDGMLQYAGSGVLKLCDGTSWFNVNIEPCNGTQAVGTVCADGTIYLTVAGMPMYTTPCDEGQTGTKGNCTGTRGTYSWNDGSSN